MVFIPSLGTYFMHKKDFLTLTIWQIFWGINIFRHDVTQNPIFQYHQIINLMALNTNDMN